MSAASRDAFSRPVFDQTIRIQSNHAQRLLDRGFLLVVRALYGIDVVLRIIGDDEEMDQVEEIVGKLIGELAEELKAEHARLAQLRESNGISATPRYTNPKRITVHISSPQLAQYTALIEELDRETGESRHGVQLYSMEGAAGEPLWVPEIEFERTTMEAAGREVATPEKARRILGIEDSGKKFC